MEKRLGVYSKQEFDNIAAILTRVCGGDVDKRRLLRDIYGLLTSMALIDGYTYQSRRWRFEVQEAKTEAELSREAFAQIEASGDPVELKNWPDELHQERRHILARLDRRCEIRSSLRRDPGFGKLNSDDCSESEIDAFLRAVNHRLDIVEQSKRAPGAPLKDLQRSVTLELAEVYIDHTGYSGKEPLPHSVNSRFVQFVSAVCKPLWDTSETSQKAISARCRRIRSKDPMSVFG